MSYFSVGEVVNKPSGELLAYINPVTEFTYVQAGDIGVDYVSGSEGSLKTVIEYDDLEKTRILSTQTAYYRDSNFPTKATEVVVTK